MISVILPVKPPEPYLETLKNQINNVLKDVPHEILVQTEPGLGYAVKCGIEKAKGNIITVMDSDGSHDPCELPKMFSLLKTSDIIIGSRYCKGGSTKDGVCRKLISTVYRTLAKTLLNIKISDPMSGFVVAKKTVFTNYKFPHSYKFLLPLLMENPQNKIAEYPITFHTRKGGKSKTSFLVGIKTLLLIFKLFNQRLDSFFTDFTNLLTMYIMTYFILQIYTVTFTNHLVFKKLGEDKFLCLIISLQLVNIIVLRNRLKRIW